MLRSDDAPTASRSLVPQALRAAFAPRSVPEGLDGDFGDDGSDLLDRILNLWRQP